MKKIISIILCMSLLIVMCTGCAKTADGAQTSSGQMKILVAFSSDGDTFRDLLVASISEKAQSLGISCDVQYADDSIEKQIEQIASAEANGYSAIICRLVDVNTTLQVERAAGDLPIIFVNSSPSDDRLLADKYVYVGSDEKVAGGYQGEYVLDKLSNKSEINVAVLKGELGHSATIGRTEYAKLALAESGKKINYVFDDTANWSADTAREYMNIFFQLGGQVDCVIANNDNMALGAIEACKDNNIEPSSIVVVGVDAIADACTSIQNGEMAFSVCQSAKNQGIAAVEVAQILGSGKSIKNYPLAADNLYEVWVDYEKVDSTNVKNYM